MENTTNKLIKNEIEKLLKDGLKEMSGYNYIVFCHRETEGVNIEICIIPTPAYLPDQELNFGKAKIWLSQEDITEKIIEITNLNWVKKEDDFFHRWILDSGYLVYYDSDKIGSELLKIYKYDNTEGEFFPESAYINDTEQDYFPEIEGPGFSFSVDHPKK